MCLRPKVRRSWKGMVVKMKYDLWLALRFLRRQRLRTVTIFFGILFSCFLLTAFGSLGYDFWRQVHSGSDETTKFDSTQSILIALVIVLLLLVVSCTAVLLYNLFSLTLMQRRQSLVRLSSLGMDFRDMAVVEVIETGILYCAAAPFGYMFTLLLLHCLAIRHPVPFWITGGSMLWIFLASCVCGIHPLFSAFYRVKRNGLHLKENKKLKGQMQQIRPPYSFPWYMAGKYRHANRGRYIRITVAVIAAILLYVPAGYLIDTNISVQQSRLYAKYGIGYSCSPKDGEELEAALQEYKKLDKEGKENGVPESMLCVSLSVTAFVKADAISNELFKALRDAGWDKKSETEEAELMFDATVLFVDHPTYMKCFRIADHAEEEREISFPYYSAIFFNRYINRSSRAETSGMFFKETSLLADKADASAVEVCYDFTKEYEPDKTKHIIPDVAIDELPEGIDFNGNLLLILPLDRMEEFCLSDIMYKRIWVDGKWVDSDEGIFYSLEQCLGKDSLGHLTYTRKILQEWYSSMKGIHLAMNAICLILFSAAVWNIFSMMVFQYMERKRGLAVLWSTGQSLGGLLKILIIENIYYFLAAVVTGIPLSGLLCYYVYRIFRQAWQVEFSLPVRQIALLSVFALAVSFLALLLNGILMRHQDFLADMKEII